MGDKEKYIHEYIKENYDVPENVNEKIDFAFEKIKKGECKMRKASIIGKAIASLVAVFLCGNLIALAFGENNIYKVIFEFFKPNDEEKIENVIIEGEKEAVDYSGVKSSIGYKIQYDDESFNLTRSGDRDMYVLNIDALKDKVYFEIYYIDEKYNDLKPDEVEELKLNDKNAFVTSLIDGAEYDANKNYSWDSDVLETWHIDAELGTYIINVHYFMEATEGWGARIDNMISSFEVVGEE